MGNGKVGKGASHTVSRGGLGKARVLRDFELRTAQQNHLTSVAGKSEVNSLGDSRLDNIAQLPPSTPAIATLSPKEVAVLRVYARLLEKAAFKVNSILEHLDQQCPRFDPHKVNVALPMVASSDEIFTPAEFGARFGRSASFAYRMIYAGRIKTIPGMRHSIPRSEVERFASSATIYSGRLPHKGCKLKKK